jgi:hypothetical protein
MRTVFFFFYYRDDIRDAGSFLFGANELEEEVKNKFYFDNCGKINKRCTGVKKKNLKLFYISREWIAYALTMQKV